MTTYAQVKVNTVYADLQIKPSSSDKHFRRDVTGTTGLNAVVVQNCDAYGTPVGAAENGKSYLPPGTETLSYDADGNLLTDGRWVYVWDAEPRRMAGAELDCSRQPAGRDEREARASQNRLVEMRTATTSGIPNSTADSVRLVFDYDYMGRRIQKIVYAYYNQSVPTSGTHLKTERYAWDGWHCVAKLNGSSSESYVWGLDLTGSYGGAGGVGGLIMVKELPAPSGTVEKTHFAAYDGGGNVMALVSPTGTETTARYEYDPFGREIRRSGTYAEANAWRFSTKWTDTDYSF